MAISLSQKEVKSRKVDCGFMIVILKVIFAIPTENMTQMTPKYPSSPEIAVGTHFYVRYSINTNSVFLLADREAFLPLLPSSVSLLGWHSAKRKHLFVYPQGQLWKSQKRIKGFLFSKTNWPKSNQLLPIQESVRNERWSNGLMETYYYFHKKIATESCSFICSAANGLSHAPKD